MSEINSMSAQPAYDFRKKDDYVTPAQGAVSPGRRAKDTKPTRPAKVPRPGLPVLLCALLALALGGIDACDNTIGAKTCREMCSNVGVASLTEASGCTAAQCVCNPPTARVAAPDGSAR